MLRKLAGQTAIYGLSTIAVRLLNFMLTPYLTRVLSREDYGVIGYWYSLIPLLLILLTMGMETGYFRFAGRSASAAEKKNVFQTTWGAVTAAAVVFFAVAGLFNRPLSAVAGFADQPSYLWMVAGIVAMDAVTAVPFARLREEGRAMKYVTLRLMTVLANILLCVFFYSVLPNVPAMAGWWDPGFGAGYYMLSNLVASLLALFLLRPAYKGCRPRIEPKLFRAIFLYSLPLLIGGIAGMANEFIDRQFLMFLLPAEDALESVGIYTAVAKIAVILPLFVQMYRLAAEPFFLSDMKKEDFVKTNAEAMKYFVIVSVLIFLMISLYPELFAYIIGKEFREGIYILPVILLGNIFSGMVLNLSFWYKQSGQTKFAMVITGTGLVFTVALNIVLILVLGYLGAALARLGCEIAMVVVSYRLNRRYCPTPYAVKRMGFYFLTGGIAYFAGRGMGAYLPAAAAYTGDAFLIGAFILLVVKKERMNVRRLAGQLFHRN